MQRLVPFKVKVEIKTPSSPKCWEEIPEMVSAIKNLDAKLNVEYACLLNKIWTVVGVKDDLFLLIRDKEIAQWVKQDWCYVQEE